MANERIANNFDVPGAIDSLCLEVCELIILNL